MPPQDGLSLVAMWLQAMDLSSEHQRFNLQNGKNNIYHAEVRKEGISYFNYHNYTCYFHPIVPFFSNHCPRCFYLTSETWAST